MTEHRVGRWAARAFLLNLLLQAGIVVTGGLVRLTGSGLGCPTWPECVEGSVVPTATQAQGWHRYVEFGNRLLTFVLLLGILAALATAWRERPRRRPLVLLAGAGLGGVLAQAVLGGITVRTGLNPYTVAGHFLVSAALVAAAVALRQRGSDAGDGPPVPLVRSEVRWLARSLVVVAAVVVVLGTVVTGSGPHSGDVDARSRFGADPRLVSWLHADAVILFLGLTVALLLALRLTDGPAPARRQARLLLSVTLAQGAVGYVQSFTDLPWLLVLVHIGGAMAVWIAVLTLQYRLRERRPRADEDAVAGLAHGQRDLAGTTPA